MDAMTQEEHACLLPEPFSASFFEELDLCYTAFLAASPRRLGFVFLPCSFLQIIVALFKGRNGQRLAILLMQAISIAVVLVAPYCDRRDVAVITEGEGLRYFGLVLFAPGLLLTTWAEAKLGKMFSTEVTIQEGHKLVTDGLYRYVRHPRYLGIITFSLGIALAFRSWIGLALVLAMTPVLLWRIHDEEELMHEEFGPDWEAYSRRSWRLVPFMY